MNARSVLVYSVLRLLTFLVPFGLLLLLPVGRQYWLLSAIFAALIGLSLSVLFLRRPLEAVSAGLAARRTNAAAPSDEDVEDAAAAGIEGAAQPTNAQNRNAP